MDSFCCLLPSICVSMCMLLCLDLEDSKNGKVFFLLSMREELQLRCFAVIFTSISNRFTELICILHSTYYFPYCLERHHQLVIKIKFLLGVIVICFLFSMYYIQISDCCYFCFFYDYYHLNPTSHNCSLDDYRSLLVFLLPVFTVS